jgi:hypothetical protein
MEKVYYQPDLTPKEWESNVLLGNQVYKALKNAKSDFPEKSIIAYEENDIEDIQIVDDGLEFFLRNNLPINGFTRGEFVEYIVDESSDELELSDYIQMISETDEELKDRCINIYDYKLRNND